MRRPVLRPAALSLAALALLVAPAAADDPVAPGSPPGVARRPAPKAIDLFGQAAI